LKPTGADEISSAPVLFNSLYAEQLEEALAAGA
jgi:hypothetical protein